MSETPGEPYAGEGEKERGLLPRWLGLPKAFSENRKLGLAGRHLSILGAVLCLALSAMILAIYRAETLELGGYEGIEQMTHVAYRWTAVFSIALAGSVLNRMVAIGFTGFKYKRYDALQFPHDLVIALRAPFVAVALVALGVLGVSDVGLENPIPTLAAAFGLGYFSDMAFERFRDAVRTLLGKEVDSDQPELPLVQGVDVPLRYLELDETDLPGDLAPSVSAVAELRGAGIEYGHELIALWRTPDGRSRLANQTDLSEAALERIVQFADVARTGAPLPVIGRLIEAGFRSGREVATADPGKLRTALEGDGPPPGISAQALQRKARKLLEDA